MKCYDRVQLVLGLICGLFAIHAWKSIDGSAELIWCGVFVYSMIKCLLRAFAKPKEHDDENKKAD